MLNNHLHHGNTLFINAVNCKSKLADMETMYKNTTADVTLKEFEFVRNKQMSELLKAAEPLGSLKFCQIEPGIKRFTKSEFVVGSRVRRGPDWSRVYGNQGGGRPGTITRFNSRGWTEVKWDNGQNYFYRVGQLNSYDLEII
ncbi:E3 ubiquitin-protein ligase Ufd4-like [Ruditapes philippinarum]|uniref:E3 ubiquitin-protein ligase Ufd4-like n=1 Tax=Ruditapes philippinarum TaxID=129788 RepID=UPI00295C00E7|nr:E3 ubiquitin-protein ligase Ufd4-like [Ruditapes philippinarum]